MAKSTWNDEIVQFSHRSSWDVIDDQRRAERERKEQSAILRAKKGELEEIKRLEQEILREAGKKRYSGGRSEERSAERLTGKSGSVEGGSVERSLAGRSGGEGAAAEAGTTGEVEDITQFIDRLAGRMKLNKHHRDLGFTHHKKAESGGRKDAFDEQMGWKREDEVALEEGKINIKGKKKGTKKKKEKKNDTGRETGSSDSDGDSDSDSGSESDSDSKSSSDSETVTKRISASKHADGEERYQIRYKKHKYKHHPHSRKGVWERLFSTPTRLPPTGRPTWKTELYQPSKLKGINEKEIS
jgi:hypothetical protein